LVLFFVDVVLVRDETDNFWQVDAGMGKEGVPANSFVEVLVERLAPIIGQREAVEATLSSSLIWSELLRFDQKAAQMLALLFGDVEVFHWWRRVISVDMLDRWRELLIDGRLSSVRPDGSAYQGRD
jgi:hypothetical protein